ncbi:glycosyltransferase [Vibrio sp. F13]|uniref:glycosyltransferase family 2 protein n=1 Tax=Vibrio sp. F13 TaxID=2070777 RepID=UPI0010BD6EFD|nr:glycosyltransferase [Vibrio sp. F13]TKF99449.1 glycosyltransferase [Vibrio sp. F13]
MESNPLVSFIIITYNQEKYIKEAILGAFSQTYEPLEIILSDDNSPDGTFEIMQKMAYEYQGPHKIVLNKNNPNQGIGGHINRVMEISQGEFIVINAGDDISLPERTTELVDVWLQSDRKAKSVCSDCYKMDLHSNVYDTLTFNLFDNLSSPQKIIESNAHVIGATHGWDREIFDFFGPIDPNVIHEDRVLPLRSTLIGKVEYVNKPLIKYRDGGISSNSHNMTAEEYLYSKRPLTYERYCVDYNQKYQDLELMLVDESLLNLVLEEINYYEFVVDISKLRTLKGKLSLLGKYKINKRILVELIKYAFSGYYSWYIDRNRIRCS